MLLADAFVAVRSRRVVVLIVIIVGALILLLAGQPQQVHWGESRVRLLAPESGSNVPRNALVETSPSVIPLAELITMELREDHPIVPKMVGTDVTIVDVGITDGTWVRVPDSGGQWAVNRTSALLVVQASGADATIVRLRLTDTIRRISDLLEQMQTNRGVSRPDQVDMQVYPGDPRLQVAAGRGGRVMATGGLLTLGAALASALYLEGRRARVRR